MNGIPDYRSLLKFLIFYCVCQLMTQPLNFSGSRITTTANPMILLSFMN
jgi:hypothetical protein